VALSPALPILPTRKPSEEEKDALEKTALLRRQGLEDLCLAERIERALRATGYGPLRCIEVAVQARLVVLRGRVPSYYLKQVAQTVALAIPGTHQIRNELNVG
jgi:osmotically-inducible protein OsmY